MMIWRGRRILPLYGLLVALGTLLLIGIPSDIIANPLFGREVPVRWWEYPVLGATALLTGLWFGIGRPVESPAACEVPAEQSAKGGRLMSVGVFAAWFAVACPVCNKLVLLVLGTSGAMGLWAPAQPYLAAVSLLALAGAVVWKWRTKIDGCAPQLTAPSTATNTDRSSALTPMP